MTQDIPSMKFQQAHLQELRLLGVGTAATLGFAQNFPELKAALAPHIERLLQVTEPGYYSRDELLQRLAHLLYTFDRIFCVMVRPTKPLLNCNEVELTEGVEVLKLLVSLSKTLSEEGVYEHFGLSALPLLESEQANTLVKAADELPAQAWAYWRNRSNTA